MGERAFSVRIAWESDTRSPDWELQTDHPGFANWLSAALFANQATSPSPVALHLQKGRLLLALDTGHTLVLAGDGGVRLTQRTLQQIGAGDVDPRSVPGCAGVTVTAWRLPSLGDEPFVADCTSYRQVDDPRPASLSHLGLDGSWRPSSFEVLGPEGHVPVTLQYDETGNRMIATVERTELDESEDGGSIALATRT
ncbi:MAG TPA: hypothetical protein VGF45_15420 [Polyangia bacterium]